MSKTCSFYIRSSPPIRQVVQFTSATHPGMGGTLRSTDPGPNFSFLYVAFLQGTAAEMVTRMEPFFTPGKLILEERFERNGRFRGKLRANSRDARSEMASFDPQKGPGAKSAKLSNFSPPEWGGGYDGPKKVRK